MLVLFAYRQELEEVSSEEVTASEYLNQEEQEGMIQLENPYSVEIMRKALAHLTANGRTAGNFDIQTTNLYVRFYPLILTK